MLTNANIFFECLTLYVLHNDIGSAIGFDTIKYIHNTTAFIKFGQCLCFCNKSLHSFSICRFIIHSRKIYWQCFRHTVHKTRWKIFFYCNFDFQLRIPSNISDAEASCTNNCSDDITISNNSSRRQGICDFRFCTLYKATKRAHIKFVLIYFHAV